MYELIKYLFILFAALLLNTTVAASIELYVPEVWGKPGNNIEIPVKIDHVDNLAGIKLVIDYDKEQLSYINSIKTELSDSLMHVVNDRNPGRLIIVMAGAKGIKGEKFVIMNLRFRIRQNIKNVKEVLLKFSEIQMMTDQLQDLHPSVKINPIRISSQH